MIRNKVRENFGATLLLSIFLLTACAINSSDGEEYSFLHEEKKLTFKYGSNVEPNLGHSVYEAAIAKFPDIKIYENLVEIDLCENRSRCDYIIKYTCQYSCWGNPETRLCGIEATVDDLDAIRVTRPRLVGVQIEC